MGSLSYTEQLRAMEAREAARPQREYLSNEEFRKLKAALTRAKNSGDPEKVLKTVAAAVARFDATTWPDSWATWRIALEDASWDARRRANATYDNYEEEDRLMRLSDELHAASLILFRN